MDKTLAILWVLFAYTVYDATGQACSYGAPEWRIDQSSIVEWRMYDKAESFTLNVKQSYSKRHNKLRWDLNDETYVIWSLGEQRLYYVFPASYAGQDQLLYTTVDKPLQRETRLEGMFLSIIYPNLCTYNRRYNNYDQECWERNDGQTYSTVCLIRQYQSDPKIIKVTFQDKNHDIVTEYRNHRFEEPDDSIWYIPGNLYRKRIRMSVTETFFEEMLVENYLMGSGSIWPKEGVILKNLRFSQGLDLVKNHKRQRAGAPNHNTQFPYTHSEYNNYKYPMKLDWRRCNAVTDVKNQDICAACAAFAAVGALESAYFINHNVLMNMSVQAMIDCSWRESSQRGMSGCLGGYQDLAFEWVAENNGIPTTEQYGSFKRMNGKCKLNGGNWFNLVAPISSYTWVPKSVNALKMALLRHGPLAVGITVDREVLLYKKGDLIRTPSYGTPISHIALLVGYDVTPSGEGYWIVRNSWGPGWGNNGYFYVLMSNERNPLRLLDEAFYVNMKDSGSNNTYCGFCDPSCKV